LSFRSIEKKQSSTACPPPGSDCHTRTNARTRPLTRVCNSQRAAEAIMGMLTSRATVLRAGDRTVVDSVGPCRRCSRAPAPAPGAALRTAKSRSPRAGQADLAPGDVVLLQPGDRVPADLRLIAADRLQAGPAAARAAQRGAPFPAAYCRVVPCGCVPCVAASVSERVARCAQIQESVLTGESVPVTKRVHLVPEDTVLADRRNIAFTATMVMGGTGAGVVVGTGDYAEIGRIAEMVGETQSMRTNLVVQLEIFGRYISALVLLLAGGTFALAYFWLEHDLRDSFKTAVAVAVAIIPEGLPAVVTISLALAMQVLARANAIIRQLPAVETLGSVTVICSDKTGTLTRNEMTVQKVQTTGGRFDVGGVGYAPDGALATEDGEPLGGAQVERLAALLEGAFVCNDANLVRVMLGRPPNLREQWVPVGYPTEVSLMTLAMKLGVTDFKALKARQPRVAAIPFASEQKFMATLHQDAAGEAGGAGGAAEMLTLHVKGAPERLIRFCKEQAKADAPGETEPMDAAFWAAACAHLSSLGLRVLAIARARVPDERLLGEFSAETILRASDAPFLCMVGLVGILDPPRPEAVEACRVAAGAGIDVKMITGDHPDTAAAVARQLGIMSREALPGEPPVMTGAQLDAMSDGSLDAVVLKCSVFARASPENKLRIVRALQRRGQTCSMTGDGVNDAPALKAANIGVAMGVTGTDVAKEAAGMVLADDNFATIVRAVAEGRRVWDNLVKIMMYNMPVNFAQGFSVLMALVIDLQANPLTAVQVLYVNCITSVTLGLMLAAEPAEPSVMSIPPRRKDKRLFGKMVRPPAPAPAPSAARRRDAAGAAGDVALRVRVGVDGAAGAAQLLVGAWRSQLAHRPLAERRAARGGRRRGRRRRAARARRGVQHARVCGDRVRAELPLPARLVAHARAALRQRVVLGGCGGDGRAAARAHVRPDGQRVLFERAARVVRVGAHRGVLVGALRAR